MPPLLEFMLNPLEMKSKEKIINILINKYPLSIMQIHHSLDGDKHSYQATFKNVKELVAEGILQNDQAKYKLSLAWIIERKKFFERLAIYYNKIKPSVNNNIFSKGETSVYEFDNLVQSDLFWSEIEVKGASISTNPIITWEGHHVWWVIGNLENEDSLINNHAKHHAKIYVKITGNTSLDKISRKYYSGKNCISKIVPSFNNINYYGTSGPFLLKLSVPKELAKQLDELYQKARSYEDLDYIRFMELINGKQKINVELINNSFLAETIAKKIISDVQSVR
ncbi:MAG TPA: hypothetical protein VJA23_01295 [Candidatus Nanoarchaeia archaeon]|nr:hypothetical protein [Candidatus Nanoarchaeia archaeon]